MFKHTSFQLGKDTPNHAKQLETTVAIKLEKLQRRSATMPANKDTNGTWTVQCYYTDWTGNRKKKKKRGFTTKKAALEWEREFLSSKAGDVHMSMESFAKLYMDDMKPRIKETTYRQKLNVVETKILPYFGKKQLCSIAPSDVRSWQNTLLEDPAGYSQTYLRTLNNQLSSLFNYAVKYYNLPENPCRKTGSIGKGKAHEMQFWTLDEYRRFRKASADNICEYMAFQVLYYTGMRCGELLALTPADIDLDAGTISISKTYTNIDGKDVVTPPKTPKSNRVITIPSFLVDELRAYMARIYDLEDDIQLFEFTHDSIRYSLKKNREKAGVKKIRIHDIRHSHASLLIEQGFSPLLIADRLGHESVQVTLNTYAHLYPNKQEQVAARLQELV